MTEADHIEHPIGWSVHDVMAPSSAVVLEVTQLMCGKEIKERAPLAEDVNVNVNVHL